MFPNFKFDGVDGAATRRRGRQSVHASRGGVATLSFDAGANVNCESYSRDTPLKRACRQQRTDLVHKLLDYDCNRRPSAFAILEGEALMEITLRLEEEKRKKVEEYEKLKRLEAAGKNKKGKKVLSGLGPVSRQARPRDLLLQSGLVFRSLRSRTRKDDGI